MLKRGLFLTLILALLQLVFLTAAGAETVINYDNENNYISDANKWTKNGSPYIIEEDVEIGDTGVLIIEAGVVVKFMNNTGMYVYGTLGTQGTADSPVYFTSYRDDTGGDSNRDGNLTSAKAGDWNRINISDNGTAVLNNSKILYAGQDPYTMAGIYKTGSGDITLNNCTISDSKYNGLYISYSTGTHEINNCTFVNSGDYDVCLDDITTDYFSGEGNTFTSNPKVYINDGGTIGDDIIFKKECSPYSLGGYIEIGETGSLTIEPGVALKFGNNIELNVNGVLNAQGTEDNPIYFTSIKDDTVEGDSNGDGNLTSAKAGDWDSIYITGNGTVIFEECEIRYAGQDSYQQAGIYKTGSGVLNLNNCIISDSKYNGLYISYSTGTHEINNCTFVNSGKYDVYLDDITTDYFSGEGNTFTSNPKVYINGGTIGNELTFKKECSPYYIGGNIEIGETGSLTIEPGVALKFENDKEFTINGVLNAKGTEDNRIYFTSIKDDTAGGDSNGDGSSTSANSGDWDSINITGNGTATFEECEIRYAGQDSYRKSGIYKSDSGVLTLTNSTISNNKYNGLYVDYSSSGTTVTGNTFCDNGESGIYLDNSAANIYKNDIYNNKVGITCKNANPVIGGSLANANKIYDNTDYGVQNLDTYNPSVINARHNWWGEASGPSHSSNPEGKGDKVSDNVDFSSYLTAESGQPQTEIPVKLPAKTDVEPDKEWTVKFNLSIDTGTINKQNITVSDANNNPVEVDVTPGNDGKSVIVKLPEGELYQAGKTYTILIKKDIKSTSNAAMNNSYMMEFTIRQAS